MFIHKKLDPEQRLFRRTALKPVRMMSCKNGFTLIELLVVVLIIGILAAIALPQYRKAVERSRAAEGVINIRALANAMELYKLANGEVARSLEVLDLQVSGKVSASRFVKTANFTYDIRNFNGLGLGYEVVATRNGNGSPTMAYYFYQDYMGHMSCVAMDRAAIPVCQALCLKEPGTWNDWWNCPIN